MTAKAPAWAGISGVRSKGGWREMRGENQLMPTGKVMEFVAKIDQD